MKKKAKRNKISTEKSKDKKVAEEDSLEDKTPEKELKISSGIKNLDKLIKGGFENNSINLVVASGGSGKTIFSTQFLIEGIKRGENCLYITFEEKKEEFYFNMKEIGFDLEEMEKKGKFFFLEYTPEKVKIMLEEGGGIIESLVLTKKIKRIAIDSLTSFGLLFESDLEKRKSSMELFSLLRKWNCATILTYEKDPIGDSKTNSHVLEFEADSIILLYFVRDKKVRKRFIEILKMRGTDHSKEIWPFEIQKGGIMIGNIPFKGDISKLL